jgi:hypothetical protein
LVTGSVPTERLPERSHEVPNRERRKLVRSRDISSEDAASASKGTRSIKEFLVQLQQEDIEPWRVGTSNEEAVRIELNDSIHDIPKYTVVVNSALEFNIFVFNWPVPDDNLIFKENKCSVMHVDAVDLLRSIESSRVCDGLAEDIDVDIRCPHFQISLHYRAVGCQVLTGNGHSNKSCKSCMSALNALKRVARAKSKSSAAPAKPKAPLSACGPEKLKATVIL